MRRETDGVARRSNATLCEKLARALRRIFGAPDYEAYLEHCRQTGHAGRLTEKEYIAEFFEEKGKRARCC